jgi:hypothetical protein
LPVRREKHWLRLTGSQGVLRKGYAARLTSPRFVATLNSTLRILACEQRGKRSTFASRGRALCVSAGRRDHASTGDSECGRGLSACLPACTRHTWAAFVRARRGECGNAWLDAWKRESSHVSNRPPILAWQRAWIEQYMREVLGASTLRVRAWACMRASQCLCA